MTCASRFPPSRVPLHPRSCPHGGSPELCAPAFAEIAPRHRMGRRDRMCRRMCGQSCFGTDKERRRGMSRGGAFTKNGEGRGTAGNRSLRMGEGALHGMRCGVRGGPLRRRATLCARFPLTIPHGAEKSNLFVCCRTLLCAFTAVECIFHALLTVESLTFPRILPIIKVWKKNRTTWRPSSARTSCA